MTTAMVREPLTEHLALLDRGGIIRRTNPAWDGFGREVGQEGPSLACRPPIGASYLDACRRAAAAAIPGAGEVLASLHRILDGSGTGFELEYAWRTATAERWFCLHASPLSGDDGGAAVTHTDITAFKQAELAAQRRAEELADFVEQGAVGLHWVGPDGRILWANRAELDLLGYTAEEYIGHHIAEFHADQEVITDILARLARGDTLHSYEARLRAKDGTLRHVLISSNVRWDGEQFVHTRCFTRDITERKRVEEAQRFLDEASTVLAASLDYSVTLARVARLAVSGLASYCFVDLLTPDSRLERVAVAHADPALEAAAQGLRQYPSDLTNPHSVVARVVRTGQAAQVTQAPEVWVERIAQDAEHGRILRALQPSSCLAVPLLARGQTLGALVVYRVVPAPPFAPAEVALAEELARRAAIAMDNARLYAAERAARAEAEARGQLVALTADVGLALSADEPLPAALQRCAQALVVRLDAAGARLWTVDETAEMLLLVASAGQATPLDGRHNDLPLGADTIGRIAQERTPHLSNDVQHDPAMSDQAWAHRDGITAFAGYPLLAGDRLLGVLALVARRPLLGETRDVLAVVVHAISQGLERERAQAERARILEREQAARAEAEAAVRARDQFLSIAAHELKTPVAIVKSHAQVLLRLQERGLLDPARLTRSLATLDRSTTRLSTLTSDLLDIARLRLGRLAFHPEWLDLAALVQAVIVRYQEGLAEEHHLVLAHDGRLPALVADRDRLEQVLTNLLDNAVKYSPAGSTITVTLALQDGGVLLTVQDEGIGLPPGTSETIFEPFGRAANAARRHLPGMGLGLYICRGIIERHGGRIWAASAGEEQGTTLSVWLPGDDSAAETGEPPHPALVAR